MHRQAEDRAHRIGQTKQVKVVQFILNNPNATDAWIWDVLKNKEQLSQKALNNEPRPKPDGPGSQGNHVSRVISPRNRHRSSNDPPCYKVQAKKSPPVEAGLAVGRTGFSERDGGGVGHHLTRLIPR